MTYSLNTLNADRNGTAPRGISRFAHEMGLIVGATLLVFWAIALLTHSMSDAAWSTTGTGEPAVPTLPAGSVAVTDATTPFTSPEGNSALVKVAVQLPLASATTLPAAPLLMLSATVAPALAVPTRTSASLLVTTLSVDTALIVTGRTTCSPIVSVALENDASLPLTAVLA